MSVFEEIKVRVKNTFLELVEDEEGQQPTVVRAQTDSKALRRCCCFEDDEDSELSHGEEDEKVPPFGAKAEPLSAAQNLAVAAAVATVSVVKVAAQAVAASAAVPSGLDVGPLPGAARPLKALGVVACSEPRPEAPRAEPKKERSVRLQGPRKEDARSASSEDAEEPALTTVMLRNLPNDYTRDMVLELLIAKGLDRRFDFLYVPMDFSRKAGLGYAFVNMISPADAQLARQRLEGFKRWTLPSSKVCAVGWSNPTQGLEANIERYRNSPVMHPTVPDEFKPALFANGKRTPFPEPTKRLRRPEVGKSGRQ